MDLFVFSSSTITNIWAGVGARMWAVSDTQADNAAIVTRASRLRIGSLGVLYCVPTQSLTVPFVVTSIPDPGATISNVWPEDWRLPFGILPLGSPQRQMPKQDIATLPIVASSARQWNNVILTQGQFAFQPSHIGPEDWEQLIVRLT
jgi:hypothetical protein